MIKIITEEKTIKKISDITVEDVICYLRISDISEKDEKLISSILLASKKFIKEYTGIESDDDLDKYTDMIIVVYVLCEDMYDNRSLYVDKSNLNKVVTTILGLHDYNLL